MHFKVNHKFQLDWEDGETIFFIVMCERVSDVGTSTRVCTNANKQGIVSRQFTTVGHSTVNQITEFDVCLETGVNCFHDHMKLVGKQALRSYLEVNELFPMTHGPLHQILSASIESDILNPAQLSP